MASQQFAVYLTASASTAMPGDVVQYTLTVINSGDELVNASVSVDLSDVVDDATLSSGCSATLGLIAECGPTAVQWSGDLSLGGTATTDIAVGPDLSVSKSASCQARMSSNRA